MAWTEVRHRLQEGEHVDVDGEGNNVGHCSQAVILSCLHLAHEMALREVGMYAWTVPAVKDPTGSMMKIMKRTLTAVCQVYFQKEEQEERKADEGLEEYEKQIKAMSRHADLGARSFQTLHPTPSSESPTGRRSQQLCRGHL